MRIEMAKHFVFLCLAVLSVLCPCVIAGETNPNAAKAGPFLRVTALEPSPDGIVFRIGWSHPYRSGGAHGPMAFAHLSRVLTLPPRPKPKPKPKEVTFNADDAVATEKELEIDMDDSFGDPMAEEMAAERRRERAEKELEEAASGPKLPTSIGYNDPTEMWLTTARRPNLTR